MIRDPKQFLDDLSQAISDGREVDWGHVTGDVDDPQTRALIEQLRVVAGIAQLHRDTQPDPADAVLPRPDELIDVVDGEWGRLTLRRIIGRGARGLVYRAWDPHLDREVALKLIADQTEAAHADEVIGEARQLARVTHPNVATIFGAERSNGLAGLWMELIEGRTLEQMLRDEGVFSAREAALIGVDVCAALSAVHKAGVLHRDIKATNVMRDRGGRLVLMDFGTSRLLAEQGGTISTDEVGTPLYMAPELLLGGKASVRSDIYSVGVLLYRLVTGSVPVEAASIDALKQAHAAGEPRRLSDERSDLPLAFIRIVERAIARDPAARYASAGALEMALASFLAPTVDDATPRSRSWWPAVAAGLVGLVAGAAVINMATRHAPQTQELRFPLYPPPTHEIESLALAPDGTRLAFTSAGQLWLRLFDRMEPRVFPNTQGAHDPFWSPDGQFIAFFKGVSLWKVPADGGEPQMVAPARRPSTGSWGRNGALLYSVDLGRALVVAPAAGGEPTTLREQVAGERVSLWWPSFLPSGDQFVYSALDTTTRKRALYLGRVDSPASEDRLLVETEGNVLVAGDTLYFAQLGQLMRQRFDAASGTLVGAAETVADHVRTNPYNFGIADVTASPAGPVAFVAGVQRARQLQLVDAEGRVLQNLGEPGEYRDIALSHDGTRLAFEEVDPETGTRDVWMQDLARPTRVRLSQHPADETSPMWAPDDRAVYFMSNRDQQTVLLRRPVDSSGQEQLVLTFDVPIRPTAITADGLGLFYEQLDQLTGWDLWWRPLDGGPPQPYLQSPFHDHEPVPSPDGRFVAYASPDSGGRQVYLGTRTPSERRWQVSADYGREPLWRADGRELFFHGKDRQLMAVRIDVVNDEPVLGTPRPLFELRFRGYDLRYHYAPLPDGRRFILNAPVPGSTALPATIVVRR
jgi:Tol biopolymer transport system component